MADSLLESVSDELKKWASSTKIYGTSHVTIRLFLIVTSAIVAAQKTLETTIPCITTVAPLLALAVTIVTSIDTWLKPREKWKGFMEDRDALEKLKIQVNAAQANPESQAKMDALVEEFDKIRRQHREKNVF